MISFTSLIAVIILFILPSGLLAETKEIVAEGTYNMGDGETPSVAEIRALLKAKQIALEQAGTYVESYSKVKNMTLTQDEIHVLASGLMEVEILDKKRTVVGDGINFWVRIKAKVNSDNMDVMAQKVKDKSAVEDYKRIQEAYERSQKEIENLKKQMAMTKNLQEQKVIESKIAEEERSFEATDLLEQGRDLFWKVVDYKVLAMSLPVSKRDKIAETLKLPANTDPQRLFNDVISLLSKAISKNPKFAAAYSLRGRAYAENGNFEKALSDSNKAIALQPTNAEFYSDRGIIYRDKGMLQKAIADFNKVVELNPDYAVTEGIFWRLADIFKKKKQYDKATYNLSKIIDSSANDSYEKVVAYMERATIYSTTGDFNLSFNDINKAIKLDNDNLVGAREYALRGNIYRVRGENTLAIEDYSISIKLDPQYTDAYILRGKSYLATEKYDLAVTDFDKAIDLDSKNVKAYEGRANAYLQLAQYPGAVLDYGKVIQLRKDYAEAYVGRGVSYLYMEMGKSALTDFKKACKLGNDRGCLMMNKMLEDNE